MNSLKKNLDEDDFKPTLPFDQLAYGPVTSRRLGSSLGINFLGNEKKVCNFDCPYCDLGYTTTKVSQIKKQVTFPSLKQIEESLREKIVACTQQGTNIDYITLSGNGEPTLYPEFAEAVSMVKGVRDQLLPETKLTVLSNGSTLNDGHIVRALNLLDERMIKLDAGNEEAFARTNAPLIRMNLAKLIHGTKKLKDLVLQSAFIQGAVENCSPSDVDDWIEVVGIIKPKLVHIYSIDRRPAMTGVKAVPRQRLKEISLMLEKKTLIKSLIFS